MHQRRTGVELAPGAQQLGTPWALVATAAIAVVRGRRADAAVALVTLPASKCVEVLTKRVVQRPRPFHVVPTALRDDAPLDGPSMPSGHAAIATAAHSSWRLGCRAASLL